MVCCGEVRLIVPDWLAGWLSVESAWACEVLTCGSCFSAALRCRRGPQRETGGQEPAVGEAVRTGAGQTAVRYPPWGFLVIDWNCLMHWDQLNGHRCADPTPQTPEPDESVYSECSDWFWCHLDIWFSAAERHFFIKVIRKQLFDDVLHLLWIQGLMHNDGWGILFI